jgi:molybdate transport system substrate-binding protein
LIVFAAASLTDVLKTIAASLLGTNNLRFSFVSSSTLAKQIEQGAPAHLFISADEAWMDH